MSIRKRARISGKVIIAKTMLVCPQCGHRDVSDGDIDVKCPKCKVKMVVEFCSTDEEG